MFVIITTPHSYAFSDCTLTNDSLPLPARLSVGLVGIVTNFFQLYLVFHRGSRQGKVLVKEPDFAVALQTGFCWANTAEQRDQYQQHISLAPSGKKNTHTPRLVTLSPCIFHSMFWNKVALSIIGSATIFTVTATNIPTHFAVLVIGKFTGTTAIRSLMLGNMLASCFWDKHSVIHNRSLCYIVLYLCPVSFIIELTLILEPDFYDPIKWKQNNQSQS